MRVVFVYLALACFACKVMITVAVVRYFESRSIEVNKWLARFVICAVAHRYRRATLEETGRVAPLYYALVLSTALLIVSVVGAFLAGS